MTGCVDTFGITDIGPDRDRNDDQFLIADLKKAVVLHQTSLSYDDDTLLMGRSQAKLFILSDGASGGNTGERSSLVAIQSVVQSLLNSTHWLRSAEDTTEATFLEDLAVAFDHSQQKIRQFSATDAAESQCAGTLTIAKLIWPRLYVIHTGSASTFLYRAGELMGLTNPQSSKTMNTHKDDSAAVDFTSVPVPRDSADNTVSDCGPSIRRLTLQLNDKLLLCTDGLTSCLSDAAMAEFLAQDRSSEETCYDLIRAANQAGGADNMTVILAQFMDGSEQRARHLAEQLAIPEPDTNENKAALNDSTTPAAESDFASPADF